MPQTGGCRQQEKKTVFNYWPFSENKETAFNMVLECSSWQYKPNAHHSNVTTLICLEQQLLREMSEAWQAHTDVGQLQCWRPAASGARVFVEHVGLRSGCVLVTAQLHLALAPVETLAAPGLSTNPSFCPHNESASALSDDEAVQRLAQTLLNGLPATLLTQVLCTCQCWAGGNRQLMPAAQQNALCSEWYKGKNYQLFRSWPSSSWRHMDWASAPFTQAVAGNTCRLSLPWAL
jgi:hypothetical protein